MLAGARKFGTENTPQLGDDSNISSEKRDNNHPRCTAQMHGASRADINGRICFGVPGGQRHLFHDERFRPPKKQKQKKRGIKRCLKSPARCGPFSLDERRCFGS